MLHPKLVVHLLLLILSLNLAACASLVIEVDVYKGPLINHAHQICFLVNATKNADLVERVLRGDPQLPASRVVPTVGNVTWILGLPS